MSVNAGDAEAANAAASRLMKRGIALLAEGGEANTEDAIVLFDEALALRLRLPFENSPWLRYCLAASWLNRADALARLGETRHAAARESCDEGIRVARELPFAEDPRYPRRLAIALQNRGLALQSHHPAEAAQSFREAIDVLDAGFSVGIPDRPCLQAVVSMNLANALLLAGDDAAALASAVRAIALAKPTERENEASAEAGLNARHAYCRAAAPGLTRPGKSMPPELHDVTDAVDEGLDLIRDWERRGVTRFRAVAADLLRFGARVYSVYQPQFVEEFLRENLDPALSSSQYVRSPEIRAAKREVLAFLSGGVRIVLQGP